MSQYKIAFFDIDGTMIDMQKKQITEKMVYTLKALQKAGVKICISTGRGPCQLPDLGVTFDGFLTYNGSYCFTKEQAVYDNPLSHKDVMTVLRNATALGRPVNISLKDSLWVNGMDEDLKAYFEIGKTMPVFAEDFDEKIQQPVYQFMLGCHPDDYPKILADTDNAKMAAWWDRAGDVVPANSDKGIGVKKMVAHMGYTIEESIAFGDGGNDKEMLLAAGTGVAMGNALDDVKALADEVCGTCAEDGIYDYCVEHGMISPMEAPAKQPINYKLMAAQLKALIGVDHHYIPVLSNASALLWEHLQNINWAGFYLMRDGQLVLGPFQGKSACIHIAVGKGVCGTAVAEKRTQLVPNVHEFPGHIACDSASNSEVVVPICQNGEVIGVLDIDSPLYENFSEADAAGLEGFVKVLETMVDF